ncbi:hypothetical protein ACOKM3_14275 [Streptomyces sp. BH106]|uniref:hypothetical protein n=1 Tax=Streptomyces sp. BH106 TaxID=3410409 RepID=UPI003CF3954A
MTALVGGSSLVPRGEAVRRLVSLMSSGSVCVWTVAPAAKRIVVGAGHLFVDRSWCGFVDLPGEFSVHVTAAHEGHVRAGLVGAARHHGRAPSRSYRRGRRRPPVDAALGLDATLATVQRAALKHGVRAAVGELAAARGVGE